ncbi:MAG: hypothetical protein QGI60_01845 [archaeon]|jgi:hypothetical protein|nr:hypothetical protein [archaeon]
MAFNSRKTVVYAILVVLIIIFVAAILAGPAENFNVVRSEGVLFMSNTGSPLELIPGIAGENEFIVSSEIYEAGNTVNPFMLNASNLFVVVLVGNGRQVTQVFRVADSQGNTLHCLTNYGDFRTEERLEAGPCSEMLESDEKPVILIEFPDSAITEPTVEISDKRIVVKSNTIDALNNTSFTVLRAMFSNADEVLAKSNEITGMLR